MQPEDQEHLGRPSADPFHARERGDHLVIRQRLESVQHERAILHARTEIAYVAKLLWAQTDGTELLIAGLCHRVGRRQPAEERRESTLDGRGGLVRELLSDDRVAQRAKRIAFLSGGETARAVNAHQISNDRVAAREDASRAPVINGLHERCRGQLPASNGTG